MEICFVLALRVQTIDQLYGARINVDDGMMLLRQRSGDRVMS